MNDMQVLQTGHSGFNGDSDVLHDELFLIFHFGSVLSHSQQYLPAEVKNCVALRLKLESVKESICHLMCLWMSHNNI